MKNQILIRFLFFLQSCLYILKLQLIKLKEFPKKKIPSNKTLKEERIVFEGFNFFAPEASGYNHKKFENLNKFLINFFNKYSYPEVFIDIGAFIGLYSFLVNKIYSNKKKKITLYSFEPTKYAFNFLNKNTNYENHKTFNFGVSDEDKTSYISTPKYYYSDSLSNTLKSSFSMKSLNEKKGYDSEEVKLITLLNILKAEKIEKAHIKIDVEGSEMEIIKYLDKNNIYPKSFSIELNNHYIYKKFLTLDKILGKNFKKKYKFFINCEKDNSKLIETNIDFISKKILFSENINIFKNLFYPKLNSFDLYLIKRV